MSKEKQINDTYPGRINNDIHEDEIDLSRLFTKLWSRKWLLLGGAIGGAILALLIALLFQVQYAGRGTILIKQGQGASPLSSFVSDGGLAGALLGGAGGSNIQNEIAIMKSREAAERMADALLENPIMENGRMYPVLWEEWPSDSVIAEPRVIIGRLMGQLEYTLEDKTTIVEVTNESPSPYEAKVLSNLAMQTYQKISLEQSRDLTGTTAGYLVEEQSQIEDSLAKAERALRDYMEKNEVVELQAQTEQQIKQYAEMTGKRYEAQAELEAVNASIEEYETRLNKIKPGLAEKLSNAIGSTIQKLQFQISELETKRALIYARNPDLESDDPVPPEITEINKQLEELQQRVANQTEQILQASDEYLGLLADNSSTLINTITEYTQKLIELRVKRLQFLAQIEALTEQIEEKNQFLENVPENSLQMARLKRRVEVNQELYLLLTKQLAQARFQTKSDMPNSRIIDEAILPLNPSFPRYWLFLAGGLFIGGLLALGYVTVGAFLDDTIDSGHFLELQGYRVVEFQSISDPRATQLLGEFCVASHQASDITTLALLPVESNFADLEKLLANLVDAINAKAHPTTGISLAESNRVKSENTGNLISANSFEDERGLKHILSQQKQHAEIILIGDDNGGVTNQLSIARMSDRTWIIAQAGVTQLKALQQVEKQVKAVHGRMEGVILINN